MFSANDFSATEIFSPKNEPDPGVCGSPGLRPEAFVNDDSTSRFIVAQGPVGWGPGVVPR